MRQIINFFCIFFVSYISRAETTASATSPTFRLSGDAKLTSNFVYRGLTYTDKDPGMNAGFYFNFGPQFKFGFSGSNVKFDDTHLWLAFKGLVKIDFSPNAIMSLSYANNRFYKTDTRNGTTLGMLFDLYSYRLEFDMESNWEGTSSSAQYFNLSREFKIPWEFYFVPSLGYTSQASSTYSNYFDLKTALVYKTKQAGTWELAATYNSNASQFNGQGDTFLFLSTQFEF